MTGFCRLPEHVATDGCKIHHLPVTWTIMHTLPGIDEPTYRRLVQNALDMWASVCGLTHRHEYTARLANILCTARAIDGSGQVLGETELPCGLQQVRMWLDNGERWDTSGRYARNGISAQQVVDHEICHALGLGHAPERGNIMYWQHDPDQHEPGPWDIQQMRQRYGKLMKPAPDPTPAPEPKPNKPTGDDMDPVKERILFFLGLAEYVTRKTPTDLDDKVLEILKSDTVLDLLAFLYHRFLDKTPNADELRTALADYTFQANA